MAKSPSNTVPTAPSNPIQNPVTPLNQLQPNCKDTGAGTTPYLSTPTN